MKMSQIITSTKATDAQNGSHAETARSFRLRVSEWKQLKKILMKNAHVTVLVPAQTKPISLWNQAYLEQRG